MSLVAAAPILVTRATPRPTLSTGNALLFARHTSHVTRHTSHVARHTSHVTRHTSHVTRHTSHVTRHTSHVILRVLFVAPELRTIVILSSHTSSSPPPFPLAVTSHVFHSCPTPNPQPPNPNLQAPCSSPVTFLVTIWGMTSQGMHPSTTKLKPQTASLKPQTSNSVTCDV